MVEFLLVAVILGIGLLGLAALMATSTRGYAGSRTRDTATGIAGSVLDRLDLDGRLSATLRATSATIPTSSLIANAADNVVIAYLDPATGGAAYDLQGQPTVTTPVYTVSWVRRANKALAPVPVSQVLAAEVVVNVQWNEAVQNPATGAVSSQPRYISVSRYIRY